MLRRALPFALLLSACGGAPHASSPSTPASPPATPGTSASATSDSARNTPNGDDASAALDRFLKEAWEASLASDPVFASTNGDRRWNDKWPDVSAEGIAKEQARPKELLEKLHAIPRAALSAERQLDYDLFERQQKELLEGTPYLADRRFATGFALFPITPRDGIQLQGEIAEILRFETAKDYEDWIARMHAFPAYMDQTIALLREAIRRHYVHPRIVAERVAGQIDKQLGPIEASAFYK